VQQLLGWAFQNRLETLKQRSPFPCRKEILEATGSRVPVHFLREQGRKCTIWAQTETSFNCFAEKAGNFQEACTQKKT
jgi:hypothetical protein